MFPGGGSMGPLQAAYTGMGANGQFVTVLPAEDMVIAHTVDFEVEEDEVRLRSLCELRRDGFGWLSCLAEAHAQRLLA